MPPMRHRNIRLCFLFYCAALFSNLGPLALLNIPAVGGLVVALKQSSYNTVNNGNNREKFHRLDLIQNRRVLQSHMGNMDDASDILHPSSTSASIVALESVANRRIEYSNEALTLNRSILASLVLLSCISGYTSAYLITLSKVLISSLDKYIRQPYQILAPILGAISVGSLYIYQRDLASPGPESSFNYHNIYSFRRQILRLVAVVISIGSGNAVAFTGMAAEIGLTVSRCLLTLLTALSRNLGRPLLSPAVHEVSSQDLLLLAGAAGGVAANFDVPFTGILYAYEVAQRWIPTERRGSIGSRSDMSMASLMLAMVSSLSAVIYIRKHQLISPVAHLFSNNAFALTSTPLIPQVATFAILGAICGLFAHFVDQEFRPHVARFLSPINVAVRPLVGGIVNSAAVASTLTVATVASEGHLKRLFDSQALSEGYPFMQAVLRSSVAPVRVFRHLVLKTIALVSCLASGLLGGAVAPVYFLGADIGHLIWRLRHSVGASFSATAGPATTAAAAAAAAATTAGSAALYGLAGAAAVLAAWFNAPLTAIALTLELVRNFDPALPVAISVIAAVASAQALQSATIRKSR